MTAPGLLDFFVLEASEYLEQLDGMLAGGASTPDAEALQRSARGLRGSATMARLAPFAELAAALERVARAVRAGALPWDRAVGGALVSAVDDLKILLHAARTWSDAETEKARTRTTELLRLVPEGSPATATPGTAGGVAFLSNETANVAAGLEFLLTAPGGGGDAGIQVLQRVRALRGIAAIRDIPSLPDALEGAEQAAAPLEQGRPLSEPQREVLRHAATLLRALALAVRTGRPVDPDAATALEQSLDRWLDQEEGMGDPVVPIASLFHGDGGPHVVTATPNPPTTAAQRFRLEMVSQGEHVRLLAEEARSADPGARERYRRHVRRALRAIRRSAESFGEPEVARALEALGNDITTVDDAALDRLRGVARRLSAPFESPAELAASLREAFATGAASTGAPSPADSRPPVPASSMPTPHMPLAAIPAPAPPPPPTPNRSIEAVRANAPAPRATPGGTDSLASLLERGVTAVASLGAQPLAERVQPLEAPVVPIGALVYRGKAALRRALELRDEMREAGGPPDTAAVDELFDLIELALAD